MNKRGQGAQFNWIFVIVSGAIILGFFVMFTFKYIELQERRQDVAAVRFLGGGVLDISSKLQVGSGGAAVSANEGEGLRFGFVTNLGYKCVGNDSLILINGGDTAWYKLQDEIVFMDSEMRVNALNLWILPWNFPFHVSNFIYLGDPDTTFYLVKGGSSQNFVDDLEISSVFNVQRVTKNQLQVEDNSKVVYFTQPHGKLEIVSMARDLDNVNFVHISLARNEARFFDLREKDWSDPVKFYVTEDSNEQLLGAIFSSDANNFECNVNKSIERVRVTSKVYSERAKLLSRLGRSSGCGYGQISNSLGKLSQGDLSVVETINTQNLAGAGCLWVY